jgi:hypothetical protein
MGTTYFKSMQIVNESSVLGTTTFPSNLGNRVVCQTLVEILDRKELIPNTWHHHIKKRLCVSVPTKEFTGSYRPEGILFETDQNPDYCSPVDLMALTTGKTFTSSDYSSDFIQGANELIFKSVREMLSLYPSPEKSYDLLMKIRNANGLNSIARPFLYNECCFERPVGIRPTALVGRSPEIMNLAKGRELTVYTTVEDFVHNNL